MPVRPPPSDLRLSLPEQLRSGGARAGATAGRAVFSPCGRYRWWLERRWRSEGPTLVFIGLNPSRADDVRDDPTLRRLLAFARSWGFGSLEVLNLFARVTPAPALLRRCPDPVGVHTDAWIRQRVERLRRNRPGEAEQVWVGWGDGGSWRDRDRQVLALLEAAGVGIACLGRTAAGRPRHPLYRPASARLEALAPSWKAAPPDRSPPCPASPAATPSTCC